MTTFDPLQNLGPQETDIWTGCIRVEISLRAAVDSCDTAGQHRGNYLVYKKFLGLQILPSERDKTLQAVLLVSRVVAVGRQPPHYGSVWVYDLLDIGLLDLESGRADPGSSGVPMHRDRCHFVSRWLKHDDGGLSLAAGDLPGEPDRRTFGIEDRIAPTPTEEFSNRGHGFSEWR